MQGVRCSSTADGLPVVLLTKVIEKLRVAGMKDLLDPVFLSIPIFFRAQAASFLPIS